MKTVKKIKHKQNDNLYGNLYKMISATNWADLNANHSRRVDK